MVGNTCANIFTYVKSEYITPMSTKSETGISLDRINQDVRVANEIFKKYASYQTGYNTDMQSMARKSSMDV